MENINRGMHGDSLPMLAPTGASNRKPLPLGIGYITNSHENTESIVCESLCDMLGQYDKMVEKYKAIR